MSHRAWDSEFQAHGNVISRLKNQLFAGTFFYEGTCPGCLVGDGKALNGNCIGLYGFGIWM